MATKPLIQPQDASTILNTVASQRMGSANLVNADLSNISAFGKAYEDLDSGTKQSITGNLVTLVTQQVFDARGYVGSGVNLVRSTSPYGTSNGITQKIRMPLMSAVDDSAAYDPTPGTTNDPFKNHAINTLVSYYDKPINMRFEWSVPQRWGTGMFLTQDGFNKFVELVSGQVDSSLRQRTDALSHSLLASSMGLTVHSAKTKGMQCINLLKAYNAQFGQKLTVDKALGTPEFLRYATRRIFEYVDFMREYTPLFNEMEFPNSTDTGNLQFVFLSEFEHALNTHLKSDVYHDEYLSLPTHGKMAWWQGSATENAEAMVGGSMIDRSTIDVTIKDLDGASQTVKQSGILATIFDTERVGIYDLSVMHTSQDDPVGLKTNNYMHVFGKSIIDPYYNSVVFYIE